MDRRLHSWQGALPVTTKIDSATLQRWLSEKSRLSLVDVLPEEYFAAQHLPGARRACVYEVDFLDQIERLDIRRDDPVVLYGAGDGSLDSAVAAEKLAHAGFRQLFDYSGGRADWQKIDGPFEGHGRAPAPREPEDRSYTVDAAQSSLEWIGRSLTSTHRGAIRIAQGNLQLRRSKLTGGRIELDMQSITDADIGDLALRHLLERHLKSDDFFDVARFPVAAVVLHTATKHTDATPGVPNYRLAAELTIKGVTRSVEFPAIVSVGDDAVISAVAQLEIDRTEWNVLYGSGRFFKMLGKHLVNDAITLLVKIVAR